MRDMLALLAPAERAPVVSAELRRRVAVLLDLDGPAEVPEDTPLILLGLDSLQLISLRHGLAEDFAVTLPPIGEFLVLPVEELTAALVAGPEAGA